jgi:hypothetical protein
MDSQTVTLFATGAGAFFTVIGAGVYALKKNGLITFGKPKERRNCVRLCSEHANLVRAVEANTRTTARAVEKLDQTNENISTVKSQLSQLVGYIKGKDGQQF